MRVYLAGIENPQWALCAAAVSARFTLSTALNAGTVKESMEMQRRIGWTSEDPILDSGLFSFMFGGEAKKVAEATLQTQDDFARYTRGYLQLAQEMAWPGPIVEVDAQRLAIGPEGVAKLRKEIETKLWDPDRMIFVWHTPDGIEGLRAMVGRFSYIGLGCPELRKVYGKGTTHHTVVMNLIREIRAEARRKKVPMPRIHLLGNTEPKLMETTLAFSCDSTSWITGRYGHALIFDGKGITAVHRESKAFHDLLARFMESHPNLPTDPSAKRRDGGRFWNRYYLLHAASAWAYAQYQEWIDARYQWIGDAP